MAAEVISCLFVIIDGNMHLLHTAITPVSQDHHYMNIYPPIDTSLLFFLIHPLALLTLKIHLISRLLVICNWT